jgi:hypothetical protein
MAIADSVVSMHVTGEAVLVVGYSKKDDYLARRVLARAQKTPVRRACNHFEQTSTEPSFTRLIDLLPVTR